MCLGRFGGTNDPCSAPIASIERDEIFAGQNKLEEKVKAVGPLRGQFGIFDWTANSDDPSHARNMEEVALHDMGVPEENLAIIGIPTVSGFFKDEEWKHLRGEILVGAFPTSWAADVLSHDEQINLIAQHDVLFVAAAGNVRTAEDSNLWYPDHPHWGSRHPDHHDFETALSLFATGKVILATYATLSSDGNIVPHGRSRRCGLAKEYCYSIMVPGKVLGTSAASVRLGALSFYLFQLWDTPREVVNVLNVCADDVGEPGVDEEFGRGIVSVVCNTVQNRERRVVANSMTTFSASPVLTQMSTTYTAAYPTPQFLPPAPRHLPAAGWFKPFYAVRGYNLRTVTGHLGGQFSLKGTDVFVSGGADYTPLGVRSSLLYAERIPFTEVGGRRTLFSQGGHTVSLLGAYGYSKGSHLSAHVRHMGTRYEYQFGKSAVLALHAGYQQAQGRVGIPGYRQAGANRVPFTNGNPEVRLSLSLGK